MFDDIIIDESLIKKKKLVFKCCDSIPSEEGWQTKDFDCCLNLYLLKPNKKGQYQFHTVGPPNNKYKRKYTAEEVKEKNKNTNFAFLKVKLGDTYFLDEAYLLENRKITLLPHLHGYYEIYHSCDNHENHNPKSDFLTLRLKFTDGKMVSCEKIKR